MNGLLQTIAAQSQFAGWLASFNTIKLNNKHSLHLDVQLRTTDEWKKVQTFLIRPGINFHLSKKTILSVGYAYINNYRTISNVSDYLPEHRLWEQFIIPHQIKKVSVLHRFRLEERFLPRTIVQSTELETDGFTLAGRFRYFIRSVIPLKKQETFTKGAFVAIQNEIFLNIFGLSKVNNAFFDQNRFYLAAGFRINPKADLEIGYMNQYVKGRSSMNSTTHALQIAGYLRL